MNITTFILVLNFIAMNPEGRVTTVERSIPMSSLYECKSTAIRAMQEFALIEGVMGGGWVCLPQNGNNG